MVRKVVGAKKNNLNVLTTCYNKIFLPIAELRQTSIDEVKLQLNKL